MGSIATILSRCTGAAMIWWEIGWQGDMIGKYQTCGKQAAVTQKLCDYINAEGEADLTQPAHRGPRENWLWLLDGDSRRQR